MHRILTQEEIDALLTAVGDKKPGDITPSGKRVQVYDFKHPERISKDQMRTLRTIHDNFARLLATQLSTTLRTLIEVNLLSLDQAIFSEYSLSVKVPSALYMVDFSQIEGRGLLEISPSFLLYALDRLLGGFGDVSIEPRELTLVEQNVVLKIVNVAIAQLEEAWAQVQPLGAKVQGYESDPQFVQIARASDVLAVVHFEIHLRNVSFPMNIVFPYYLLDQILARVSAQLMLAQAARKPDEEERQSIKERIFAGKLPLRVVLAQTTLKVKDFIDLQPDDIIQVDMPADAPVEVFIGDRLKFLALPGKLKRKRAVRILRPIIPQEVLIYE